MNRLLSIILQFSNEELVKEVENSIAEFKRHKQDYDEERVSEQVSIIHPMTKWYCWLLLFCFRFVYIFVGVLTMTH